jgi:hypothetical protein
MIYQGTSNTNNTSKTRMYLPTVFDEATALVKELETDIDNDQVKEQLVNIINNILQYACVNCEDRHMLMVVMQFLVTLFYRVGELDYDSVENVLDALTMSRATIRELLQEDN